MKIKIMKAEPILADKPIEDCFIDISEEPRNPASLCEAQAMWNSQARAIFKCLKQSLPSGTIYELLIIMLQASPILYRGPMAEKMEGNDNVDKR